MENIFICFWLFLYSYASVGVIEIVDPYKEHYQLAPKMIFVKIPYIYFHTKCMEFFFHSWTFPVLSPDLVPYFEPYKEHDGAGWYQKNYSGYLLLLLRPKNPHCSQSGNNSVNQGGPKLIGKNYVKYRRKY